MQPIWRQYTVQMALSCTGCSPVFDLKLRPLLRRRKEHVLCNEQQAGWAPNIVWTPGVSKNLSDQEITLRSLSPAGPNLDPELVTQKLLISVKWTARLLPTRRPRVQIPDRAPLIWSCRCIFTWGGRGRAVGIATRYWLDGPGIESLWEEARFSAPVQTDLLFSGYRVIPGGKAAGAWRWPLTPSSAEVKERVQLYLYSPMGLHDLF